MSEEALANIDAKIASLEEAILKCEVQLQKAKRQCETPAAGAVAAHHESYPQVVAFLRALQTHPFYVSSQIQLFELQRLGREKELLLEEKRQLRDEKLLLLMSKLPVQVGSSVISQVISNSAQSDGSLNEREGSKKRSRGGGGLCDALSGLFSWHLVTPLTSRRMGPAAATVRIGHAAHIIITGGYNGDVDENVSISPRLHLPFLKYRQVATCEALLSNGQASPVQLGDMHVARAWHCAVACSDYLYVMGGADNAQRYLCSVERCTMQDRKWLPCAPMTTTRYGFAAVALHGLIYCIGGYDGETWLDSVERYCPDRCLSPVCESCSAAETLSFKLQGFLGACRQHVYSARRLLCSRRWGFYLCNGRSKWRRRLLAILRALRVSTFPTESLKSSADRARCPFISHKTFDPALRPVPVSVSAPLPTRGIELRISM
jgi:hypothetical protein